MAARMLRTSRIVSLASEGNDAFMKGTHVSLSLYRCRITGLLVVAGALLGGAALIAAPAAAQERRLASRTRRLEQRIEELEAERRQPGGHAPGGA